MTPQQILNAVIDATGVTLTEIEGPRKTRSVADARKLAAYLMRRHTRMTNREIAGLMGKRDHHTAMYGARVWQAIIETEAKARQLTARVESVLVAREVAA